MTRRRALLVTGAVAIVVVGPLGWLWWSSLLPGSYSVMEMGYLDYGGAEGEATDHAAHQPGANASISITDLAIDDDIKADVQVELVTRSESFTLASGRTVDGYTVNGQSPGPTIEAVQGDVVEVRLANESVADGVTLHWHGIDVPNTMDGVAGVTQNAVMVGESFTYRFAADRVGTYWYHSHQVSHEQVLGGLLGAVIIHPRHDKAGVDEDVPALVHIYDGVRTVNGQEGDVVVSSAPGDTVRVRVINTDNGPMSIWTSGADFTLVATDGYDVHQPSLVSGQSVLVTAGGRADLEVVVPAEGARVELGGNAGLLLGSAATAVDATEPPESAVDLLTYGSPAPIGFDPDQSDREFVYSVDRRPGFLDGRPGLWWTINGHLFPDIPMFMVAEGDIVRMRLENSSGEVHPMHLHGHHAVVVARDGVPATGSPWWVDSLNVRDGETYDLAFVANNPGIWLDHCHNLPHATEGLITHLAYEGYTTPFVIGGTADNAPE